MTRTSWKSVRKAMAAALAAGGSAFALTHVERVEHSERRRFMFVSKSWDLGVDYERRLGERAWLRVQDDYRVLPASHPHVKLVEGIGSKIAREMASDQLQWEFCVVDSWMRDVTCLPGGKVIIHSGLLDALGEDEDSVAAVLFHEAAHGYLRHGGEKISLSLLAFGTLLFLVLEFGVFFFFYPGSGPIDNVMTRLALDLPFTRKQEIEADTFALRLMARACYDPRASAELHKFGRRVPGPLLFFSKHGIHSSRSHELRDSLRAAVEIFEGSDCQSLRNVFNTPIAVSDETEWPEF